MSYRALKREWDAKLRASGFVDLEPNGDGSLSDRGNLHPVAETESEWCRLGQRVEDGESYTSWAQSVLHNGPKIHSRQERETWRLHAQGLSEIEIGTALTISRRRVRQYLTRTRNRVSKVSKEKRWANRRRQRAAQMRSLVRRCDPRVLVKLVAVMMRQQGLG